MGKGMGVEEVEELGFWRRVRDMKSGSAGKKQDAYWSARRC